MAASALADRVVGWMEAQRPEMLALLERLVRLESPSRDAGSQEPVLAALAGELEALGFRTLRISGRHTGGSLYARGAPSAGATGAQLLLGHSDTVWPRSTLETMPFALTGGRITGPGVYDMKGGLTQLVFALRALSALGLEPPLRPVVFVNSDEEISSPESERLVRRLARVVERAYVLEPSLGHEGRLKTARKGVGRFTVTVTGRAAHAGLDPEAGINAILELAHVLRQLEELNDPARGVTVNPGTVQGGLDANVVAPEAGTLVGVRVRTREDAARVEAAIRGLRPRHPDARITVEGRMTRPPMEPTPRNRALWETAQRCARELDVQLDEATAGGASDGNTTSAHTATLDGLGAVGDGAHAPHEFIYADKLVERAALLTLLLLA